MVRGWTGPGGRAVQGRTGHGAAGLRSVTSDAVGDLRPAAWRFAMCGGVRGAALAFGEKTCVRVSFSVWQFDGLISCRTWASNTVLAPI
jgi:hypothetical protein